MKDVLPPVLINGQIVEIVNKYKYLGLTIDDKLPIGTDQSMIGTD